MSEEKSLYPPAPEDNDATTTADTEAPTLEEEERTEAQMEQEMCDRLGSGVAAHATKEPEDEMRSRR